MLPCSPSGARQPIAGRLPGGRETSLVHWLNWRPPRVSLLGLRPNPPGHPWPPRPIAPVPLTRRYEGAQMQTCVGWTNLYHA
jgi:hypothetical protein